MTSVHIRFPTLQDLNACFQVDGRTDTEHVWQVQRSLQADRLTVTLQRVRLPRVLRLAYPPLGDSLRERYEARDGLWVAISRGQVIGFVEARWDTEQGLGWVEHLVVDRSRRREGVGSALLRRVAQAARDRGLDRLIVSVNVKNDPAVQFLFHHGFTLVGYNEVHFGSGDIALYLARPLRHWV